MYALGVNPNIFREQPPPNDTLVLLTYGEPDFEREKAEKVVAKKWRMKFQRVAGCVVSPILKLRVEWNNKYVTGLASDLYGNNWQVKFDSEVDKEVEIETKIERLLSKLTYIRLKDAELMKTGNGLHFIMEPITGDLYKVSVEGWSLEPGKGKWVSYFRLTVNHRSEEVKLMSKETIEI